ncbi:MAG: condensation domain-containing protein, partial [Cyanobacteria bacterium P01_F01_bin.42]
MTQPTVNLSELSDDQKRKLLQKLMQQKAKPKRFPLSFAQQRLWFIEQLQPGGYTIPALLKLKGNLQLDVLEKSFTTVIERHESLRTTFGDEDGQPYQVISEPRSLTLEPIDISHLPEAEKSDAIAKYFKDFVAQPFDLENGPLIRCQLLHVGADEHVLGVALHHIIADYFSVQLMMREVALLYQTFLKDLPNPLDALSLQYVDFAHWQRKSQTFEDQLEYWTKQLADLPPLLNLPTDFPRPAVQSFQGERQTFALASELSTALLNLAKQEQVTPFMLLLAALKVLLHRYTGQDDIFVGSTVSRRDRPELQPLIGLFVNNLVFRAKLDPQDSFQTLLAQVRDITLDAYAHQDLPFEQLVDELNVERQMSHNALFQVMFILHNTPSDSLSLPDLEISSLELETSTARFDISLDMYETDSGLTGTFEYRTDLFETATIERLIGHFETVLQGVVDNPGQALSSIQLLTDKETQQFESWNRATKRDFAEEDGDRSSKLAHELIAHQAQLNPEKVAIAQ